MESRIHSHPIVPSEMGATQGSKIRRRISHLPRKSLSRARASTLVKTITSTWETTAKTKVFFSEVWNFVVETTLTKFLNPEAQRPAPHRDVAHTVVEGEEEGQAHDEHDVEDGGADHERPQPLRSVEEEAQPARACPRGRTRVAFERGHPRLRAAAAGSGDPSPWQRT